LLIGKNTSMTKQPVLKTIAALAAALAVGAADAHGGGEKDAKRAHVPKPRAVWIVHDGDHGAKKHIRHVEGQEAWHERHAGHPPPPGYRLDRRHHHDRYYPPPGHTVKVLPRDHHLVVHRHVTYHYHNHSGVWYRRAGTHFVVVLPPVGAIVPVLPAHFTIVWVAGVPYYYAGGVYYIWHPERRVYVVTEPPKDADIEETPPVAEPLFVYPKQSQSEERQAQDRYECHRWAREQTGFDPTQPGGGVPPESNAVKRNDYHRAMKACLEARGYSVQ
jgi:hypothetical protein